MLNGKMYDIHHTNKKMVHLNAGGRLLTVDLCEKIMLKPPDTE